MFGDVRTAGACSECECAGAKGIARSVRWTWATRSAGGDGVVDVRGRMPFSSLAEQLEALTAVMRGGQVPDGL